MKTLVLLTSRFPYGTGESFISSELSAMVPAFDKIIIIAQNVTGEKTRAIAGDISVFRYNPSTSISGFFKLPFLFLINLKTFYRLINEEVRFRKATGFHLSLKNLSSLFKKITKAVQLRDFINKMLKKENIDSSIVFYSYWLKTGAHAISLLKYKNSIKIARAHGSDIYEEKTESGYLPLLRFSALNLDAIFFVSNHGKEYFEGKTKIERADFFVSYLGVTKPEFATPKEHSSENFVIVSCSNMIPLKRIDLIIHALRAVKTEKNIEWRHFGDGILKQELEALARKELGESDRISFRFMGNYPNDELLNFYSRNQVDLFINTSSTEGVPVSIMEAQSFGIPVIATDTGGVKELVKEGTGTLLPVSFDPRDLAETIMYYSGLTQMQRENISANSVNNWDSNFNATVNYNNFIMKVSSILASAK